MKRNGVFMDDQPYDFSANANISSTLFYFCFKEQMWMSVMRCWAWSSCNVSTSAGRKRLTVGIFGDRDKTCRGSELWPALQQELWTEKVGERGRERGREWSFLASSSPPTSLSSWLFAQTKAADNAGAAVLTAWSWEAMKGPRGRWMGQSECSCKMTVFGERQQRHVRQTHIFSRIRHAWIHIYTCPNNLHSLN